MFYIDDCTFIGRINALTKKNYAIVKLMTFSIRYRKNKNIQFNRP